MNAGKIVMTWRRRVKCELTRRKIWPKEENGKNKLLVRDGTKCKECNTKIPKKQEEKVQIQSETEWDMMTWRLVFTYRVRDVQEVSFFKVQLIWLKEKEL